MLSFPVGKKPLGLVITDSGKQPSESHQTTSDTAPAELRCSVATSGETPIQLATSLDGNISVQVGDGDDSFLISIEALLLQALQHASEHRTKIESMLGALGVDPPGLSGWRYFDEQNKHWLSHAVSIQ